MSFKDLAIIFAVCAAFLIVGAAGLAGCAAPVVSSVYVEDDVLHVKECVLENGEIWPEQCHDRRYKLR